MDRLTSEQILDLQEEIMDRLPECFPAILIRLNTNDRLPEFLQMLGMEDLLDSGEVLSTYSGGRVIVVGDSQAKEKDLIGVAKSLGIERSRIEFVSFEESVRYDFDNLAYDYSVAAIMFGPMPHSTKCKHDSSSVISYMEKHKEMFPKVMRLTANDTLKITRTNFREGLQSLMQSGLLVA